MLLVDKATKLKEAPEHVVNNLVRSVQNNIGRFRRGFYYKRAVLQRFQSREQCVIVLRELAEEETKLAYG